MQLLNARQIREWDEYTIRHEPVSHLDLMERAATECFNWIVKHYGQEQVYTIFCGKGNNGGDGLVIARKFLENNIPAKVFILEFGHLGTDSFQANLQRLHAIQADIKYITVVENFPEIEKNTVLVDALYGSGLSRPLDGMSAELVHHLNRSGNAIIAIDMPSGLPIDSPAGNSTVIHARDTLTFQCMRPAFLMAENEQYTGHVHVLDIGLHPGYLKNLTANRMLVDETLVRNIFKPRPEFSHKGNFGHSLLFAGSYGRMGAALLAARACIHTGTGLLTMGIPECGYDILQLGCPEAMVMTSGPKHLDSCKNIQLENFTAIGAGPGIGVMKETFPLIKKILTEFKGSIVMDADALNLLSEDMSLLEKHPQGIVITPHPKEFSRMFGQTKDGFEQLELAIKSAARYSIVILLKGRYTSIITPGGMVYFNTTGNPGMATGGTGDVLTGMITALLAQGYTPEGAAIMGAYLHGVAGDIAAAKRSPEAMSAGDLADHIGDAFLQTFYTIL